MFLFILPFDHRSTFAKELLNLPYPRLTPAQRKSVVELKQLVFEGFLQAKARYRGKDELAILVDEEFGSKILRVAQEKHIGFALSVEKSGQAIFDFEYGAAFGEHLLKWRPTYAKALVRYDVARAKDNLLQRQRLAKLSQFCVRHKLNLMLEILLTGGGAQLAQAAQMIKEMHGSGVFPALWKLEGFSSPTPWRALSKVVRAPIIMLGRGESMPRVEKWVQAAAQSGVVKGFAIGRTIFFKPLVQYRDKKISREAAVKQIAANFLHFINLWHKSVSHP